MLPMYLLGFGASITLPLLVGYWKPKCITIKALHTFYPEILSHNPTPSAINLEKKLSLTFDDAPYNGTSSLRNIVDILDKTKMKGTFFVISKQINDESRKLLIEMVKNGHQLGNHGSNNIMHYRLLTESLREEINSCDKTIKSIYDEAGISYPTKMLYRPGCGAFHRDMLNLCKELNYTLTLGSVYPNDPIIRSSYINYHYLKNHIEPGDIVILHDRDWTHDTLKLLLEDMKYNKIKSVTVEELLSSDK
jgi:peptidoglycan-N-acetylglucosamine deacetylase